MSKTGLLEERGSLTAEFFTAYDGNLLAGLDQASLAYIITPTTPKEKATVVALSLAISSLNDTQGTAHYPFTCKLRSKTKKQKNKKQQESAEANSYFRTNFLMPL